jgi:phage terminase large subunit-like protein
MTRGTDVCRFIEEFCFIPEGAKVGQSIELLPFQRKFIRDIYDNKAGTSRAYLSIARKNGKSALIAAIILAHLVGPEAKENSQIISGAQSREQAGVIFDLCEKMVRQNPELYKIVKIVPSKKEMIGIVCNVKYKAISSQSTTAHGLSPILAILDEVGQVRGPKDKFIEAIETAQGAHEKPLLIAVSTQANADSDLFSIWLDDAAFSKDPRIVSHLYAAPKDCDLMDKKAWRAANPALGKFRSGSDVRDFAKQATRMPAKADTFRQFFLNQRDQGLSRFLSASEWDQNNAKPYVEDGQRCFAGLDLSSSRDLTALVLVFPHDKGFDVIPYFWLPEKGLKAKEDADKHPYTLWAEQGVLRTIPGKVIIPAVIAHTVAEVAARYDLQILAYDRWRINDMRRELDNIGAQVSMTPFGQGFKDMAPAIDKLEQLVLEGRLCHGDNPILNMCANGAVTESDPAGNRKLTKDKSYHKIDGLVALAMALGSMSTEETAPSSSPWDDPGYKLAV